MSSNSIGLDRMFKIHAPPTNWEDLRYGDIPKSQRAKS